MEIHLASAASWAAAAGAAAAACAGGAFVHWTLLKWCGRRRASNHARLLDLEQGGQRELVQDLYVIRSDAFPGLLKVGRSNNPQRRLHDLSCGQPTKYELLAVYRAAGELEPSVHHRLASMRHTAGHSREWFRCTIKDVEEAVKAVSDAAPELTEPRS